MEVFDGKQTSWEGLWWHPEYCGFSSAKLSLAKLKKFKGAVRLYVRKNKFFNGGEGGRPNYHFCLKAADSDIFRTLEVEDDEDVYQKVRALRMFVEENNSACEGLCLPSESYGNYKYAWDKTIEMLEDLIGVKIDYSYISFG